MNYVNPVCVHDRGAGLRVDCESHSIPPLSKRDPPASALRAAGRRCCPARSSESAPTGSLYRFKLTADRLHVDVSADARLGERAADILFRAQKFEGTESETLQIGRGFGTTPDIAQAPDGNLYVVSITDNVIYKISRRP